MRNYFTNNELTDSETAKRLRIKNEPTKDQWINLFAIRDNVLNPLREKFGKPIRITSGFRSPELNKAVGGKPTSQHTKGEAVDITAINKADNKELFELCKTLEFDQLIDESNLTWIHISYKVPNRKQILKL
jgi:zinc D-Ala-D-Ala carboxypeptidase